jgi:lipopolysaccharide export system protein LptA
MTWKLAIAVAATLLIGSPLAAVADDTTTTATTPDAAPTAKKKDKPVDIEADQMEIRDKEKKAIFTGHVHAKRTDVTLDCDTLVVDYGETKQPDGSNKTDVTNLDATGHVVIVTSKQKITGDHAVMDPKANKLVVTGQVEVTQGETVMRGPELHADLNTNVMEMSGGRVTGSFLPK